MVVSANLRVSHIAGNTKSLIDQLTGTHATVCALGTKPLHGGVLDDVQSTGCN